MLVPLLINVNDSLRDNCELPFSLVCDNQSALTVSGTSLPTKRAKHMQIRYHKVRELSENISYCLTGLNKADPLTKPMYKPLTVFETPVFQDALSSAKKSFAALCCCI